MKFTTEKKENTLSINYVVKNDEFEEFMQKAYEQNKGKYSIPGFRRGHVPRKVLENNYGKGLFLEDALYLCASEYYKQFLDTNKEVYPVARPELDEQSISFDKDVKFAVKVVVKPDVVLGQYKGINIARTKPETVKASEVEEELKRVQERNARFIDVTDRAAENGDEVNLDYSGTADGVKFDGGTAKGQTLTIGSKTFIEGFEEQLIGLRIGEEKDVNVTFPGDYHAENLAGKDAVFHVKINGIKMKQLPEIDDEFAKDVSEFSTLKEYKADIRKNLKAEKEKRAEREDESNLVDAVVEGTPIDIPTEMIDEQIDDYLEDFKYQLSYQGLKFDDYLKYTGSTLDALRETYRERAEKAVHTRLVFQAIVKAENIEAQDDKVAEKIKEYAEETGQDLKKVQKNLTEDQDNYFKNLVINENLMEFLKKENTVA